MISFRREDGPPREHHLDLLGLEERAVAGLQPFDHEVLDDEDAGRELRRQPADVQRPVHVVRAFALRAGAQVRTQIDREERHERAGDDRDDAAPAAGAPARRQRGRPDAAAGAAAPARPESRRASVWLFRQTAACRYSITISTRPASTDVPGVTATSLTRPAFGERSSFSIFIASTTTTPCRAATASPGATSTRTTRPGIGATTACSPCASAPPWAPARRVRRALTVAADGAAVDPHEQLPRPAVAGRRDLNLAADARIAVEQQRQSEARRRGPRPRRAACRRRSRGTGPSAVRSTDTVRLRSLISISNVIRAAPRAARPASTAPASSAVPRRTRAGAQVGIDRRPPSPPALPRRRSGR